MENNKPNVRLAALKIIQKTLHEGGYANLLLSQYLRQNELADIDRRFLTELVYGTVKNKGTLDWILEQNVSRPLQKISPIILNILRLGVFQLYYLGKVPVSAACNESVKLAKKYGHPGTVKFVNGVLRNTIRTKDKHPFPSMEEDAIMHLALNYAHPTWLVIRWLHQFGPEATRELCQFDNSNPVLSVRANTLCTTRAELLTQLQELGATVEESVWSPEGLLCKQVPALQEVMSKLGSKIYVQDESSMVVARALAPTAGSLVLDVCSAPGGKTTHLAQLMGNKGRIIACDIHEHKLKLIAENAERLGISIIEPTLQDATQLRPEWVGKADAVLVDAPCSGLGVLRRRSEARWTKTKQDLKAFPPLQKQILATAAQYVRPGGRLLYSTCTLEPAENTELVADFLATHKDFQKGSFLHPVTGEQLSELQLLPFRDQVDGFYLCVLEKVK